LAAGTVGFKGRNEDVKRTEEYLKGNDVKTIQEK
jgi:hypothetical protein